MGEWGIQYQIVYVTLFPTILFIIMYRVLNLFLSPHYIYSDTKYNNEECKASPIDISIPYWVINQ